MIPAAGRGSRLGIDCPKILLPVNGRRTIWNILRDLLLPSVDHIHVILSVLGEPLFQQQLVEDKERSRISTSIQLEPLGMGDAIFGAQSQWDDFDFLLIVWGDQVNLSIETIRRVIAACDKECTLILPLTRMELPYVQYDIDLDNSRLLAVRQAREGDVTEAGGASDVGLFALSVKGLAASWRDYLRKARCGTGTGEINFLPFLPFLSKDRGWHVHIIDVPDPIEAVGVNTLEDLQFAKEHLRKLSN